MRKYYSNAMWTDIDDTQDEHDTLNTSKRTGRRGNED